jgi:hypothetical protein
MGSSTAPVRVRARVHARPRVAFRHINVVGDRNS